MATTKNFTNFKNMRYDIHIDTYGLTITKSNDSSKNTTLRIHSIDTYDIAIVTPIIKTLLKDF